MAAKRQTETRVTDTDRATTRVPSKPDKPLGRKAYGSIPHLPNSRMGPGDHAIHEGQARIATEQTRDKHDNVIVQEKLDGSCVAAALVDGDVVALGRAGYPADTSPFEQHHLFAQWVADNEGRFLAALRPGERLVGEWLAQAHGTRYDLFHDPFVAFDLMVGVDRAPVSVVDDRAAKGDLTTPCKLSVGPARSVTWAQEMLGEYGHHGAIDPVEGAVWRIERDGEVDFLCKWVRPDKVDGCYLPDVEDSVVDHEVWNWPPDRAVIPDQEGSDV